MGSIRIGAATAILIILCAGCTGNSVQPTEAPTATGSMPVTTVTAEIASHATTQAATAMPSPTITANAFKFDEENFMQYFPLGMSRNDLKKELEKQGLTVEIEEVSDGTEITDGFWRIWTGDFGIMFSFNDEDQLYSILTNSLVTSKGFRIGDSSDGIIQLYGEVYEFSPHLADEYVGYTYDKKDYYFSIGVNETQRTIVNWEVYLAVWNEPIPINNTAKRVRGDDIIKFNEENFLDYFDFGMSFHDVEKKLTDLRIRIVKESANHIETNHICFSFEDKRGLTWIQVRGWNTAKGLNFGDPEDKLYQLYGKPDEIKEYSKDVKTYIYYMKNYSFSVRMDDWYRSNRQYGVDYWIVSIE